MEQITILGATGMVGTKLLQKAVDKKMKVKVLARNKEKLQKYSTAIEIVEGNYFDSSKLKAALNGSDIIISTIGPTMSATTTTIDEKSYIHSMDYIIKQMQKNNQQRLIGISCAGIKMQNENLPLACKLLRVKLISMSKTVVDIKDRELQLLQQSNLNWTSIRPPQIKETVQGEFVANENKFIGNAVDLEQLSDFILDELFKNEWVKKAPVVGTK